MNDLDEMSRKKQLAAERQKRFSAKNPERVKEIKSKYRSSEKYKEAQRIYMAQWKEKNKTSVLEYASNYAKSHPKNGKLEKERLKVWRKNHPNTWKKYVAEISDGYIATCLGMRISQIPKELLDAKREQLILHRLTKELKQEIINQLENENGN